MTIQEILQKHNITSIVKDPVKWAERHGVVCSFLTYHISGLTDYWVRFKNGDGISAHITPQGSSFVRMPKKALNKWWNGKFSKVKEADFEDLKDFDKRNGIVKHFSSLGETFVQFDNGDAIAWGFQYNDLKQPQTLHWIFDKDVADIIVKELESEQ